MNKVLLLASGGLDSTTMAYWLLDKGIDFIPLFINYGQHFVETEMERLKDVLPNGKLKEIQIIDISAVYKNSSSRLIKKTDLWTESITADDLYLPYRNILLLTIASSIASTNGLTKVYSAFINSNHAKEIDCSNEFFGKLEPVFGDYGGVSLEMPFRYMTKYEVAKLGIQLGAPIGRTFSCQVSERVPCGVCPNCVDRIEALRKITSHE